MILIPRLPDEFNREIDGELGLPLVSPTITVVMVAPGSGETTLADNAFSSVPKEWERLLVVEDELDAVWNALAMKHRLRVKIAPFINFAEAKNVGLDLVETDWVFVLDSDEILTPELVDEITMTTRQASLNGYYVPRANKVLGEVMRYAGWYPDYQLRLFRPSIGRYTGAVHEIIQTDEPIGHLKNDLQHDSIRSMTQWHAKIDRYTTFEVETLDRAGRRPKVLYLVGSPVKEFLTRYIRRKGYRDGIRGFIVAGMSSYYTFLAYAKLWEKKNGPTGPRH